MSTLCGDFYWHVRRIPLPRFIGRRCASVSLWQLPLRYRKEEQGSPTEKGDLSHRLECTRPSRSGKAPVQPQAHTH
jgi:hypothetical protein